jgi:hypothetical protein
MALMSGTFAVVLSLCLNQKECNDYVIDVAANEKQCHQMLESYGDSFAVAWGSDHANDDLTKWLKPYHIIDDIKRVTDYDFTCPFIPDSDIP